MIIINEAIKKHNEAIGIIEDQMKKQDELNKTFQKYIDSTNITFREMLACMKLMADKIEVLEKKNGITN